VSTRRRVYCHRTGAWGGSGPGCGSGLRRWLVLVEPGGAVGGLQMGLPVLAWPGPLLLVGWGLGLGLRGLLVLALVEPRLAVLGCAQV